MMMEPDAVHLSTVVLIMIILDYVHAVCLDLSISSARRLLCGCFRCCAAMDLEWGVACCPLYYMACAAAALIYILVYEMVWWCAVRIVYTLTVS